MYCPVCGAESTQGLNYCKRCGSGLGASTPPMEPRASFGKMMGMLLPVAVVSLGGFIALFSTVYGLSERTGFDTRALIGIMAIRRRHRGLRDRSSCMADVTSLRL